MSSFKNLRDLKASAGPSNKDRREIAARLRRRRKDDAERCARAREPRQSIWEEGRDYSGSFVTQIDAVIDDSIFDHKDVRDG